MKGMLKQLKLNLKKGKIMTKEEFEYYKHKIQTYGEQYE